MKNVLKFSKTLAIVAALFGMVFLNSCKDEEEDPTPTPVEDGFYIQGDATAYSDFDIKATLSSTKNEVGQVDRAELMDIFVAVKGTGGFNIVQVAGDVETTWGPAADFADVTGGERDQPDVTFQSGGIEETATQFMVPADGLYHVVIDTEKGKAVVVPVTSWGIIGGATPTGWSSDTDLTPSAFDMSTMTFSTTGLALGLGDFKFRYSDGWKVEIDTPDVKVHCNLGGAVDALVPGGDNITLPTSGYYDIDMVWTAGEEYAATMTKTGDLPAFDYSSTELGLVGDGVYDGAAVNTWDKTILKSTPAQDGTKFTWAYNGVKVNSAGGFKVREGDDWSGKSVGFNDVTMAGDGSADFSANGDGNFIPAVNDQVYDMTLDIDGDDHTLTAVKK